MYGMFGNYFYLKNNFNIYLFFQNCPLFSNHLKLKRDSQAVMIMAQQHFSIVYDWKIVDIISDFIVILGSKRSL